MVVAVQQYQQWQRQQQQSKARRTPSKAAMDHCGRNSSKWMDYSGDTFPRPNPNHCLFFTAVGSCKCQTVGFLVDCHHDMVYSFGCCCVVVVVKPLLLLLLLSSSLHHRVINMFIVVCLLFLCVASTAATSKGEACFCGCSYTVLLQWQHHAMQ
jgi:hypothetical protein